MLVAINNCAEVIGGSMAALLTTQVVCCSHYFYVICDYVVEESWIRK